MGKTKGTEYRATIVKTASLTYYHSNKDMKEGVEIPLKETMGVKGGMGKTKGTEYRVTLNTPKREWELGSGEEDTSKEWIALLSNWIGLPKVDREQSKELRAVVKAQWMEVRIEVYEPEEISDEELARSNTIQKSVSSFTRSFTLTGRKKKAAAEAETAAAAAAATTAAAEAANGEEEGEEGEGEEG